MMNPEPSAPSGGEIWVDRPGENCLKNSINGSCSFAAGGQRGVMLATGVPRAALILTTAGPSRCTTSAKSVTIPVGAGCWVGAVTRKPAVAGTDDERVEPGVHPVDNAGTRHAASSARIKFLACMTSLQ